MAPNPGSRLDWRALAKAGSSRLNSFKGYVSEQIVEQSSRLTSTSDSGGAQTRDIPTHNDAAPSPAPLPSPGAGPATPGTPVPGWREWAGQKIRDKYNTRRAADDDDTPVGVEKIGLFPGWAMRRYHGQGHGPEDGFEVEVFVSGYASSHRPPEFATRSQKAFMSLAKSFASLPKLVAESAEAASPGPTATARPDPAQLKGLSPSTEDLLKSKDLPPRPEEISEQLEVQALENQFQHASHDAEAEPIRPSSSSTASSCSIPRSNSISSQSSFDTDPDNSPPPMPASLSRADIQRLHDNLELRLRPFWSSVLSNRTIRIRLYTASEVPDAPNPMASFPSKLGLPGPSTSSVSRSNSSFSLHPQKPKQIKPKGNPLATARVTTGADGSFQHRFILPWDSLCQHESGVHIAFGEKDLEHDVVVVAELVEGDAQPSTGQAELSTTGELDEAELKTTVATPGAGAEGSEKPKLPPRPGAGALNHSSTPATPSASSSNSTIEVTTAPDTTPSNPVPKSSSGKPTALLRIPLTHSTLRVISDIDDTIKRSDILGGTRTIFRNVFVKELSEAEIPGMGEWYTDMFKKGARFHYVSNGPFELLPIISEFLTVSNIPPGSIKLKSYAGRSLFNGLLTAPADRKRAGLLEVLDSFPNCQFLLIGDTGEQDLELYAELAQLRPNQILAMFIRDVDQAVSDPLDDPTGILSMQDLRTQNLLHSGDASIATPRASALAQQPQPVPPPRLTRLANNSTASLKSVLNKATGRSTPARQPSFPPPNPTQMLGLAGAEPNLGYFSTNPMTSEPQEDELETTAALNAAKQFQAAGGGAIYGRPSRGSSDSVYSDSLQDYAQYMHGNSDVSKLAPLEKRRLELQMRVWRARVQVPEGVVMRVFRDPKECVEAERIVQRVSEASEKQGM